MSLPAAASFAGAKVALLESRLADETAAMVRRLGGEPVSAPSVAEVEVDADDAVAALIDRLATTFGSVIVFLTGAAVTRVFAVAERLGRTRALQDGLARAFLVTRGAQAGRRPGAPRPVAAAHGRRAFHHRRRHRRARLAADRRPRRHRRALRRTQ